MRTWVTVRFTLDGLHSWPQAPESVGHLRDVHFHSFQVTASLTVTHNDREVEILTLRSALREAMEKWHPPFNRLENSRSCEDIAQCVVQWLEAEHPGRLYRVSVWEGDWGGAEVES